MRYKYKKVEGCLPCRADSVSKSESPSFEGGETAWKAETLPTELLRPSPRLFQPQKYHLSKCPASLRALCRRCYYMAISPALRALNPARLLTGGAGHGQTHGTIAVGHLTTATTV